MKHNLHACLTSSDAPIRLPRQVVDLLISKGSFWLGGVLSGFSLLVEARHRRPELAMYVLPKALESVWKMARGRGFVSGPAKYGEGIVGDSAVFPLQDADLGFAFLTALRDWHGDGHGEDALPLCSHESLIDDLLQNIYQVSGNLEVSGAAAQFAVAVARPPASIGARSTYIVSIYRA